jgi:hypothetical protein
MPQEIPLTNDVSQTFSTDLNGTNYNFRVIWNERLGVWSMTIYDVDFNVIIAGVALLIGTDIIKSLNSSIGGMVVADSDGTNRDATVDDLGTRVKLIYLTPEEVENGITV